MVIFFIYKEKTDEKINSLTYEQIH